MPSTVSGVALHRLINDIVFLQVLLILKNIASWEGFKPLNFGL
jgi:hypothetical protein